MKCLYDETVECCKIGYANWVTGKLPCEKCSIYLREQMRKLRK